MEREARREEIENTTTVKVEKRKKTEKRKEH